MDRFHEEGRNISDLMINEQIRDREIRLVGENGEQLGIMSAREAQARADEAGLDLVKIAPKAQPPVCKIIDYSKYKYEQARKEKEARRKQKIVEIKILTPMISIPRSLLRGNSFRRAIKSKSASVFVDVRWRILPRAVL